MPNQRAKRKSNTMDCLQKFFISSIVLSVFILFAGSCGTPEESSFKSAQNTVVKKTEVKKRDAAKDTKADPDNTTAPKEYVYDAAGKTDPFTPLITLVAVSASKPASAGNFQQKPDVPLTPLQKLDLTDLNLVAIIASGSNATALVEDSVKNGYIVKEGMFIGKNDGAIKKILSNSIIVEEKIVDPMGNPETKISTLTIHKKE